MVFDESLLTTALILADLAAEIAKSYFRNPLQLSLKDGMSPVTAADLAIESKLRAYLATAWPEHGILGEEYSLKVTPSKYLWVIDPIDGTTSFVCGKPTFCTLIALLYDTQPLIGIIDQPILQERWVATQQNPTKFNGIACLQTMEARQPNTIRLSCTTPRMFDDAQQRKFARAQKFAAVTSYGGDGYSYGLLASGFIDVILEADLKFYDVAAIIPIIEGTGGKITDWSGNAICLDTFDGTILATRDAALHKKFFTAINDEHGEKL